MVVVQGGFGSTKICLWHAVVTSVQICVPDCITVCQLTYILERLFPWWVCILVPPEKLEILSVFCWIFLRPGLWSRRIIIPISGAGGSLRPGYHKSHNRGMTAFSRWSAIKKVKFSDWDPRWAAEVTDYAIIIDILFDSRMLAEHLKC